MNGHHVQYGDPCILLYYSSELCVSWMYLAENINVWEKIVIYNLNYIDSFPYLPTSYTQIHGTEMFCSSRDHT